MAGGEPGRLASINTGAGRVLGSHGLRYSLLLALLVLCFTTADYGWLINIGPLGS